ncbi:hypothetical protein COCON_G00040910 [Conger conger]|uniref:Uncharacterized protein n=1 Tax=Conger conger TaxID=82655 RepID=A0A9Q1DTL8_CONCO|nr:hypothetical protein COCON_G00040910 [Conger conger]
MDGAAIFRIRGRRGDGGSRALVPELQRSERQSCFCDGGPPARAVRLVVSEVRVAVRSSLRTVSVKEPPPGALTTKRRR